MEPEISRGFFEFDVEEVEERSTITRESSQLDLDCHKINTIYLRNIEKWQGYDLLSLDEKTEINYQIFGTTIEFLLNFYQSQKEKIEQDEAEEDQQEADPQIDGNKITINWCSSSLQNALNRSTTSL